jgi:pSer/pThr/pTyr-binding forkhead associated (FHA) protein
VTIFQVRRYISSWGEEYALRYRLRFLLQEFDLPQGTTIVGRSLECQLSIEDPLVSREHARIIIDDDGALVEDLRSRNGVRVNGLIVRGPTPLRDGDRVRIGTQDFVFCRVDPNGKAHSKTTGVLRLCARCRLPYARETLACPHCEATEQTDQGTLTTNSEDYRATWSVQLIVAALERALVLGRMVDAERIVRRATVQLDELIQSGGTIDAQALEAVAAKVSAMTLATDDPRWVLWVLDLYRRTGSVPSLDIADRLAEAAQRHSAVVCGPLGALLDDLQAAEKTGAQAEIDALARLSCALSSSPASSAPSDSAPAAVLTYTPSGLRSG